MVHKHRVLYEHFFQYNFNFCEVILVSNILLIRKKSTKIKLKSSKIKEKFIQGVYFVIIPKFDMQNLCSFLPHVFCWSLCFFYLSVSAYLFNIYIELLYDLTRIYCCYFCESFFFKRNVFFIDRSMQQAYQDIYILFRNLNEFVGGLINNNKIHCIDRGDFFPSPAMLDALNVKSFRYMYHVTCNMNGVILY